ncbi:protein FAM205A-2-like isoform X2 [Microtus ochrogaster]|uniref:Protein FAM205A-2-like isoform X2 n=1 Tax=Microtus ochrogaster TaxID=79684 RepID=A0ABM1UKT8_MICOH|nr:protein FAM205A-2-like isoform X2 [Microtus ochrogaster]
MLDPNFILWDVGYPLYKYGSIFIIALIIWHVKRSYQGLSAYPKRSCCRRHRKVRQRARDAASRARRLCREEAEKPWELLTIMKSQSWLPKEERVRQLLCIDPCCQICDAATLEIRQLLESEQSQISPALLGLPQDSSCLEMLTISSETFEQNVELHPRPSTDFPPAPVTQTLTEHLTQSASTVGVQQLCADHLLAGQGFHLADMSMVSEAAASSRLREPVVLVNAEEMMHSDLSYNYLQQIQDQQSFNSQTPFQTLSPDGIHVTHPMTLSLVTTVPPPFLNPEVVRLLELHVKKLMHFQRWGLPRRVEESLRQVMPHPPMYFQPENNQPVSLILNNIPQDYVHRFGSLSPNTWCSYPDNQPTQIFWVSQWSNAELGQKAHHGQITSPVEKPLFSPDHDILRGIWLLPKGQANDSRNKLPKTFTQLFCGLPSIHSESLVATFLGTQRLSKDTPEPSCKDPQLLKEASPFLLPPHLPPTAAPPSSASPKESWYECQTQINVPCLTLAECKTLEWHLLQRQLQLQWGQPAVIPGSPYEQSHIQYKPYNKAKPHETLKASWARKSFSVLTRDLVFIPEPVRRLLELHLQKQLIHLRWGLPQRIQRSIHLVPSSPGQQPRGALPNVSILQPGDPKADGSGDMFAVAVDRGSVPTPHLFSQAQAMLKTHVDSKYGQIHQGKVPACVQSSRECRIPRSLSVGASFSNIPASRHLELQAKSNPDLQHTAVSQEAEPAALDQEKQASSGTLIEHCKLPQALPEETVKKLETTLRHKYLAFLSGLPVHYCVTPSRSTSPATVSHSTVTEIIPGPVKIPQEPLTQVTLLEDPYRSRLEPCTQDENEASAHIARDDNETSEDIAGEVQPKVQAAGGTEKVPLETQTEILAKLSFHLKKKVLEIKLGFPVIAKEFKESNAVDPEPLGILRIPGSTALPQLPNTGYSPPAPDANRVHLGKRPATAGQAVCHKQKQPSSKTAPHGSAQWGSKASQLRNMTEAQGHCVQLETSGEKPNLEKTFSTEPQSPGKSKYSAHAPTLTEKSHASGKPKAVWDLEEGDAGLGLPLTSGKTHHDRDEELEKRPPPETPQGSSEQRPRSHPPSPQDLSEFEFPDPPPEVLMVIDTTQNMQDSLTKVDAIPEPARSAKVPQPVASKTSQGLPFPCTPTQGKPFRGQAWQENISQRQVTPASPHASPSLPETGLKNKMKSFLHSMSPKIKDKTHMEPPVSTPRKVSKPSQENADKDLPQAKNPTKKTKTENCRMPKAQPVSSERPVVTSFLTAPHILDSKLGPGSRQHGSVSGPGQPQHCPRHCPRLACATQYRNPP